MNKRFSVHIYIGVSFIFLFLECYQMLGLSITEKYECDVILSFSDAFFSYM